MTPVDKFDGETFSGHGSAYLRREISDDIDMYSSHTEHNNQEVDTLAILHQDRAVENHQQPKNTNNLIICD